MNKPLSFSGYKRFITCPKFYQYHDILGEKSEVMSSALVFGSAIDNALNDMLINHNLNNAINIACKYINHTKIDLYFNADYDEDLSKQELLLMLKGKTKINPDTIVQELLKDQGQLYNSEKDFLDQICKHTLIQKAAIILKSYYLKVLPLIAEVESVQKEITTDNNSKRGIIDTVIILKDGRRVIFDNKTASRPYDFDSVLKSPQLALYASMVNADHAGFIVMNKQLIKNRVKKCSVCSNDGTGKKFKTCDAIVNKKRCNGEWNETIDPSSWIQIYIDKIPKVNKDLINEAMNDTIKCINNGVFPRNLNNCFNMYGQSCVYMKKCWEKK